MKRITLLLCVFISAVLPCGMLLSQESKKAIDEILLNFYEKYQIPGGVSLAISHNGRLVYAGAVGYADNNRTVKLTPEHRMRIASVSKPVTAIAIMKLMEEKRLCLDDCVFGENGIFDNKYGMPTYREKPVDITIKHLLKHNSGGWGRSVNYQDIGVRMQDIERVLEKLPLEHLPGTHYDYSNFGYYVLGRIIETKSGMTYEHYVKENILKPSGIDGMRIGATKSGSDEVEYFATEGENINPSTFNNPINIDSSGGWVANPIELLKLLVRVDGFSNVKDILSNETVKMMTTRSKTHDYALGWALNKSGNNWWHDGSIPGTSSMMARSSNGFNWVILINYRPPSEVRSAFTSDIDDLFWQIHRTVKQWSTGTEL
jgi:CubicO group peptidase (beta-lactamase class C family)